MRWSQGFPPAAAILGVLILAACGGARSPASPQGAAPAAQPSTAAQAPAAPKALDKVNLRFAYIIAGQDVPFALAKVKGFYQDAGLDVTLEEGKGSLLVGQTVAAGQDTFGFIDAGATMDLISKGAPLRLVASYQQATPFALIFLPPNRFDTPADLKGKTIFSSAGNPERLFLPVILAKGGLTMNDVKLNMIDPTAYPTILSRYPDGYWTGYSSSDYVLIRKASPNARYRLFSDFGINLYNLSLVTSAPEIQQHADLVRRFVAASTRGWQYTLDHPDEAVNATVQLFPSADRTLMAQSWAESAKLIHTPATKDHVPGWMAPSDVQQSVDLMHRYGGMETVRPAADYYTDDFIPQS